MLSSDNLMHEILKNRKKMKLILKIWEFFFLVILCHQINISKASRQTKLIQSLKHEKSEFQGFYDNFLKKLYKNKKIETNSQIDFPIVDMMFKYHNTNKQKTFHGPKLSILALNVFLQQFTSSKKPNNSTKL